MNIKPILVRLQNVIDKDELIEQMVLLKAPKTPFLEQAQSGESINIIVGYNSSPQSHTALDIALLIAHQTRLATKAQVTVQVVYVLEENEFPNLKNVSLTEEPVSSVSSKQVQLSCPANFVSRGLGTLVLNPIKLHTNESQPRRISVEQFAEAENILRQAICLADEWKSPFKALLRFGCIATELRNVVEAEAAALLILGCDSVNHSIVQKLGSHLPCPVLGVPKFC
ncbi:MAG: universal stress protein [Rhizonema sp. PD37]|nr:universal stress protein [Rhizonema sp. PD37]